MSASAIDLQALLAWDRRALARAISAVENDTPAGLALLRAIHSHLGRARVLGITGPPGAGKSSLISALLKEFTARGRRIGVVAVDPASPVSGGALLGDRLRMAEHAGADNVYIRSLSSRGHLGGLAPAAARVVDVLDAAGTEIIFVETVGTGQNEVEIRHLADTRIVVCPPGLGDEVQTIKAGVLEIGDIFVVNKCDLPMAGRTQRELQAMLALRHEAAPVLCTDALAGEGIGALADAIEACRASRREPARQRARRLLAQLAAERVKARLESLDGEDFERLCVALQTGEVGVAEAADRAIGLLASNQPF